MGWEPKQVTEYEWDGDRLVRSTVTTEPEWSEHQRHLMLGFDVLQADLGPHGFRMSEATSELANAAGSGFGFKGRPVPLVDKVEVERERMRKAYKAANGGDKADMTGLIFQVDRIDN